MTEQFDENFESGSSQGVNYEKYLHKVDVELIKLHAGLVEIDHDIAEAKQINEAEEKELNFLISKSDAEDLVENFRKYLEVVAKSIAENRRLLNELDFLRIKFGELIKHFENIKMKITTTKLLEKRPGMSN